MYFFFIDIILIEDWQKRKWYKNYYITKINLTINNITIPYSPKIKKWKERVAQNWADMDSIAMWVGTFNFLYGSQKMVYDTN